MLTLRITGVDVLEEDITTPTVATADLPGIVRNLGVDKPHANQKSRIHAFKSQKYFF